MDWLRPVAEWAGISRWSFPGLHGIDRELARVLPRTGGWFVEAGAYDGHQQSNTYYLARFRGWRGVLVEPIPERAARCRRLRPESTVVECALGLPEENGASISLRYAGLMSHVRGVLGGDAAEAPRAAQGLAMQALEKGERFISVPLRSLTEVLEETATPACFDLLSLDVEGYEVEVLQGLDLKKYRPRAICIEVRRNHLERVSRILGGAYRLAQALHETEHRGDYLWIREDLP